MGASLTTVSAMSLFVEDLKEASAFYQDVFDVEVVHADEVSTAVRFDNLIVNLLDTSAAAELVEPASVAGRGAGASFQLSIWVDDVDAVCQALQQKGVPLLIGPTDKKWGMRVATFTDPAGHSWEVAQRLVG